MSKRLGDQRHAATPCSPVPSDIVDVIDHLHRETTEGPWTNRFYTGGGSTIAVPSGFLLPVEKDGHCLSSADICFIVEVHSRWPQIKAALSARSESAPMHDRCKAEGCWAAKPVEIASAVASSERDQGHGDKPRDALYRIKPGWTEPIPHWLEPVTQSAGTRIAEPDGYAIVIDDKSSPRGYWFAYAYIDRAIAEDVNGKVARMGRVVPIYFGAQSATGPTQDYIDLFEAAKDAVDEWPDSGDDTKFEEMMAVLERVVMALDRATNSTADSRSHK